MFKNLEKPVNALGILVFIGGLLGTIAWTILMIQADMILMAVIIFALGFLASYIAAVPYMAICELYSNVRAALDIAGMAQNDVKRIAKALSVNTQAPEPAAKADVEGTVEKKPAAAVISAAKLIEVALQYRTAEGTYEYLKNNFGKLSEEDQAALEDVADLMKKRDLEGMNNLLVQKKEALG